MTLGEYVLSYRQMHSMSQRKFAMLSGLSNSYISVLEKGVNSNGSLVTPSMETYEAIAKVTNCTVKDLIDFLDDSAAENKNPATESDGNKDGDISSKVNQLSPELFTLLTQFLELAEGNQDSAKRFLSFAVQELQSSK